MNILLRLILERKEREFTKDLGKEESRRWLTKGKHNLVFWEPKRCREGMIFNCIQVMRVREERETGWSGTHSLPPTMTETCLMTSHIKEMNVGSFFFLFLLVVKRWRLSPRACLDFICGKEISPVREDRLTHTILALVTEEMLAKIVIGWF